MTNPLKQPYDMKTKEELSKLTREEVEELVLDMQARIVYLEIIEKKHRRLRDILAAVAIAAEAYRREEQP